MVNEDTQKTIEPPTPKKAKAPVPMAPSIAPSMAPSMADVEPELEPEIEPEIEPGFEPEIEPENGNIPEDPTQNDPE